MDISFNCHVSIESLNSQFETIKAEKCRNCNLSLWRNEFREIVLTVSKSSKSVVKYVLQDVKIHSKFLKEGKSTIVMRNQNVRLLLSNCPPTSLKKFFQVLSVKMYNLKKSMVSERKKLNTGMSSLLDEISPLTEKDVEAVNCSQQKTVNQPCSQVRLGKRKQPFAELTNSKVDDHSMKKRALVLPSDQLNPDQKHVINLIKQGRNVFFTGSAGTGKSYLLRHIIGMLPPSNTYVTASTGVAACHIGGMTLHSFAGVHDATSTSLQNVIQRVRKNKTAMKQWSTCKHLIIDEISMIDSDLFDCIEAVARSVCDNAKPFGGIQLIVCGDFFQLPPVSKGKDKKKLCFQAKSWSKCIDLFWELHQVYRQMDETFINLLQEVRFGKCTTKTTRILKATHSNMLSSRGIIPTKLCTHIEDVKQINQSELRKLKGKQFEYHAQDSSEMFTPLLDQYISDSKLLILKVGTQVMLTKNIDVNKKLVNGARGVVIAFTSDEQHLPIVHFMSNKKQVIALETYVVKVSCDVTAIRKQLPLKLAWAISIHKSQGMSLDCVEMSLYRVFECGQAYVALSRASSLSGLRVLDFDSSCVKSNIDVLRFYRKLREQQHKAKMSHLNMLQS